MVNASSTSQLHPAAVLDDVTETEFVGGSDVKKEGEEGRFTGDGRPSPHGRDGRPFPDGRVQEGRSRLMGGRRGSSLGFGRKLSLGIDQRRHSEHRLKVMTLMTMMTMMTR